jgi:hypothetical protein
MILLDYLVLSVAVITLIRSFLLLGEDREYKIQFFLSIMIVTGYIRLIFN